MQRVLSRATLRAAGRLALTGGTARAAVVDVKVPFQFVVKNRGIRTARFGSSVERTSQAGRLDGRDVRTGVTMKKHIATALLLGALSVVPVAGFAATQSAPSTPAPAQHASKPVAATHATRGVVKSIDDKTLVVTQTGRKHAEMTFALNASTHRTGTIAAGTAVSIRYREEGKTNVATAIRAESAKQSAAHTTPSKR